MAHVTVEYMIMIPVLILQIFIFPFTALAIMNTWADSRVNLQLQEVTSHLGSSIQQLYYTINHASIASGSLTIDLDIPQTIKDGSRSYPYTITLLDATPSGNDAHILNVTLSFTHAEGSASTLVTLGENVDWQNNFTVDRDAVSLINATKVGSTIVLSLEGDS